MKKKYWIFTIILVTVSIIAYIISATVNIMLNKKYAVDEIAYTDKKDGLKGIQEIVSTDYINIYYLNIIVIFILLVYTGIIIWQIQKR